MPVSRALRRLLRVLEMEEEQSRLALEAAVGDLHRFESALAKTAEKHRGGRRMIAASAANAQVEDRLAGLEEMRSASRFASVLAPKIAEMELRLTALRQEFLGKRIEHRQAETLVRNQEAEDKKEAGRRSQSALDDWHRNRMHRAASETRQNAEPNAGSGSGRHS